MHAARALLAGQQAPATPPSKLNVVSFAGNAAPEGSPGGPRIPAGQPRKWLRIDEQGKSAFIKVESDASSSDHSAQTLLHLLT